MVGVCARGPDLALKDQDGKTVRLGDLRGKRLADLVSSTGNPEGVMKAIDGAW